MRDKKRKKKKRPYEQKWKKDIQTEIPDHIRNFFTWDNEDVLI